MTMFRVPQDLTQAIKEDAFRNCRPASQQLEHILRMHYSLPKGNKPSTLPEEEEPHEEEDWGS